MVNMAAERISTKLSTDPDPWAITDEVRVHAEQARAEIAKAKENFEKLIVPCPQDGTDSSFQRYEGAYMRVRGVFKCKNEHEFYYG